MVIEDINELTFHVGVFIHEEMLERNWDADDLAMHMGGEFGVNRLALDLIFTIRDKNLLLGDDIAAGLSMAFGTSKELWLNLDKAWREKQP